MNYSTQPSLAVVLLAGKIKEINKSLGEVCLDNKTLIERHSDILKKYGIKKIVFVIEERTNYYIFFEKNNLNIHILENKRYKETGKMFFCILPKLIYKKIFYY